MGGVYRVLCLINNKEYYGQTIDFERRFSEHQNINYRKRYPNKPLYRAIEKYGIENFKFEIIEECNLKLLEKREIFYIKKNNSLIPNGYNIRLGGITQFGEDNPSSIMTEKEIIQIRTRRANLEKRRDVYESYKHKLSRQGFDNIWNNKTWKHIKVKNAYSKKINKIQKNMSERSLATHAKFSDEEVILIRTLYVNNTAKELYKNYSNIISFSSFEKLLAGINYKHLPIYKKRKKQWVYPDG